ncbi:MAG: glycosyltransferase, partial [Phycisphaerales bacterium]
DNGCDVRDVIDSAAEKIEIKYITHGKSKGPSAARNTAICSAEGKYITYLDDDDIIYPNHIQTLADFLENSEFKIAYTDAYRILQKKENDSYITISKEIYHSQDFNREYFLIASYIAVQSIMHEKACLDKTGFFDETLTTHEDLDMWIRLSHWFDFAHIPQVTSEFYEKDDGISQTCCNKQRRLTNLEIIYERYHQWASPKVLYLQKRVLQRMYANYAIELPQHLK